MKHFLTYLFLFVAFSLFSQVFDNFNDGDFSLNPTWTGNDALFVIENNELRSNSPGQNTYYLSTPSTLATNVEWSFFVNLKFNPSSANYVDVFLMADNADLNAVQNGYFVRMGVTTSDFVYLYSLVNGTETAIIQGQTAMLNSSTNNPFNIRVKRDAADVWSLETDDGATGTYLTEGTVTDNSVNASSHIGLKVVQSAAASPINNHFFDNISVSTIGVDAIAPSLTAINVVSATQIDAVFSENITSASAQNLSNYDIIPFTSVTNALLDGTNQALVHLTLSTTMSSGNQYTLTVMNISDIAGNVLVSQAQNFTYTEIVTAVKGDIIINEFLADETPVVGLPEAEFVEIYNKSNKSISLANWKLADNTNEGTIANAVINPGEYKVLCATADVALFSNAIGVTSFQGLNNTGDDIVLKDENGIIIDKITYDVSWYHDTNKEGGGYSIELKNPSALCGNTENWTASTDPSGGTPGAQNATFDNTPDTQVPSISMVETVPPNFLAITFSEKMDSLSLRNSIFTVNPTLAITATYFSESYPQSILIEFAQDLMSSTNYSISLPNVADCSQNAVNLVAQFSLSETPLLGDLVINEILFNPLTGGADYVELKNISNKYLALKNIALADFDNDTISNIKSVAISKTMKPGDFVVLTADSAFQKMTYPFSVPGCFIQMVIPSYNDDSSTVYLIANNLVIDKVSYDDDWHFALLDDNNGKSLERLNPTGLSNDKNNWHTASSAVSFGTPGLENSQLIMGEENGTVSLTNTTLSPDNDGFEDVLQINYTTINPGMLANVSIYDDRGRLIHHLAQNEYLGTKGSLVWDGLDENKQKASIGVYVLLFNAFDLEGNKLVKKLAFVLAGK